MFYRPLLKELLGRCERVLNFMGHEVQGSSRCRMKAVKWVVAKFQGDEFASFEQCQVVVFVADDLGFLGPGIPDLMTKLCPLQDTA